VIALNDEAIQREQLDESVAAMLNALYVQA
jgi:hypothetical protein